VRGLGLTVAAAVALSVMLHASTWAPLAVLWLGLVLLALGWAALVLYFRRRMAEVRELETAATGRFRRVHAFQHWPKECRDCGMTVHTHRAIAAHATSPCATRPELAPAAGPAEPAPARYTATVAAGTGDGAVDTMLGGDGQAAELDPPPGRAETWQRIDGLIERTTQR
jgi:hypothetical protein